MLIGQLAKKWPSTLKVIFFSYSDSSNLKFIFKANICLQIDKLYEHFRNTINSLCLYNNVGLSATRSCANGLNKIITKINVAKRSMYNIQKPTFPRIYIYY